MSHDADAFRLHRWLVSFASGQEWYPVGEYVAVDAQAAIDRPSKFSGQLPTIEPRKSPGMRPRCLGPDPARKKISHRCPRMKCGLFSSIHVYSGSSVAVRYKQSDR